MLLNVQHIFSMIYCFNSKCGKINSQWQQKKSEGRMSNTSCNSSTITQGRFHDSINTVHAIWAMPEVLLHSDSLQNSNASMLAHWFLTGVEFVMFTSLIKHVSILISVILPVNNVELRLIGISIILEVFSQTEAQHVYHFIWKLKQLKMTQIPTKEMQMKWPQWTCV